MQVSLLIQFLIENCCRIFGEEITSLLGEVSVRCDARENASGTMSAWTGGVSGVAVLGLQLREGGPWPSLDSLSVNAVVGLRNV